MSEIDLGHFNFEMGHITHVEVMYIDLGQNVNNVQCCSAVNCVKVCHFPLRLVSHTRMYNKFLLCISSGGWYTKFITYIKFTGLMKVGL